MLSSRLRAIIACCFCGMLSACGNTAALPFLEGNPKTNSSDKLRTDGPLHSLVGWTAQQAFYLDDAAPEGVVEAAARASQTWNEAMGRVVLKYAGKARMPHRTALFSSLDDSIAMVYYERDWLKSTGRSSSTLATTIWENAADSDRIIKADIILNAESYVIADAMEFSGEGTVVDAQTVMLHEFGHFLGLNHVEQAVDPASVMHARTPIGPRVSYRNPSRGDIANILRIYD